jgi:uncharacterized membrane protein
MRETFVIVFLLFLTFFGFFGNLFCKAQLEWSTKYQIEVKPDGSAKWMIERGTFVRKGDEWKIHRYSLPEHLETFYSQKIDKLIRETRLHTKRDMKIPYESVKITTTTISRTETSSYGIVRYQFEWLNFTQSNDIRIIIGDAFINSIWDVYLFGDGELTLKYPQGYNVVEVHPKPELDGTDSNQTLIWSRIGNLRVGEPKLVLERETTTMNFLQKYASTIVGIIAILGIGSISIWLFKFRKRKKAEVSAIPEIPYEMEDEERVINLLKAAGGSLYQSKITKELGFSRSKTSKLLTEMENKGKLRRKRKGREKLVILID